MVNSTNNGMLDKKWIMILSLKIFRPITTAKAMNTKLEKKYYISTKQILKRKFKKKYFATYGTDDPRRKSTRGQIISLLGKHSRDFH